jgi:hypothetical protein
MRAWSGKNTAIYFSDWREVVSGQWFDPTAIGPANTNGGRVTPHKRNRFVWRILSYGKRDAYAAAASFRSQINIMTILAVALFAIGVALLMQSSDLLVLYRSKVRLNRQGPERTKSIFFVAAGILMAASGLVLFIVRALTKV